MRVFQINSVYGVGSTGRIVEQIKHRLESQGDECFVAYGRGNVNEYNTYKIGSTFDLYFHALLTRITDRTGFYSKYSTKKLIRIIKEFNPDIIHLHNLHGYYLNIEVLFAFLKEYNKPVVWTMHDCWAFTGHCAHYSAVECEKWMESCELCPQKRLYPASFFLDNCKKNYKQKKELFCGVEKMTIITPSIWLCNELKKSFLKDYDIRCIYNGIDLNVFKPTTSSLRAEYQLEDVKVILGVANVWSERKGLNDFILLAKEIPADYKVVVVGLTEQQEKMMPENVLCIPKTTSQQKLAEIYSMADVYFNASIEETMGLTTIEAMACGTPVVVYDKTAVPEVVTDEVGVVLKNINIDSTLEALSSVDKNEKCKETCVLQAKKYNVEYMYDKYIYLYKELR